MKVVVVYKQKSDHTRIATDYIQDIYRQTGHQLEEIDPETRDGEFFCDTYGIVEYPSILALDNDGRLLSLWRGLPLPLINEVLYFTE